MSNYSTTGWTEDLDDLNTARAGHACSFYTTDSGNKVGFTAVFCFFSYILSSQVLLVTGGVDGADNKLSSTEIYRNKAWTVLSSAALPSPTYYLSAGNIDNTIFVLGKNVHFFIVFIFY